MRGLQADAASFAAFRDALHDLAAAPTPTNVRRYLAASRELGGGTAPTTGLTKRSHRRTAMESRA
jgi:hypothetical protein